MKLMYLMFTEIGHLLLAVVVGVLMYKKFHSKLSFVLPFLSGFFVDADHLIDYFIHNGFVFDLANFLTGAHYHLAGSTFIIFHSWELAAILLLLSFFAKKLRSIFLPLALGLLAHLVWDQITNPAYWYTYFWVARIYCRFQLNSLFRF